MLTISRPPPVHPRGVRWRPFRFDQQGALRPEQNLLRYAPHDHLVQIALVVGAHHNEIHVLLVGIP